MMTRGRSGSKQTGPHWPGGQRGDGEERARPARGHASAQARPCGRVQPGASGQACGSVGAAGGRLGQGGSRAALRGEAPRPPGILRAAHLHPSTPELHPSFEQPKGISLSFGTYSDGSEPIFSSWLNISNIKYHFKYQIPLPKHSVQFSSVTQSCPTLCNPMNRSTPGLPVHHQLPESTQTPVH